MKTIDISKYYASLTPEFKFTPSCIIKSTTPFINMTLKPSRKLKYDSRDTECEVVKDGNGI